MEFRNKSTTQSVNIKPSKEEDWVTIPPGKIGDVPELLGNKHPNLEPVKASRSKKVEGDLNNDGVFDKKDVSLAAKTLGKSRKSKKKEKAL